MAAISGDGVARINPAGAAPVSERERFAAAASWIAVVGLGSCVLAFVPSPTLGPEGFTYPKELIFHATSLLAGSAMLLRTRRLRLDVVDAVLAAYLVLGVASMLLSAMNPWWAFRALGLSVSTAVMFWVARACGAQERALVRSGVAVALTLAAATAILEAHGALPFLSLAGRAPGGSMGNRNQLAHLIALALPMVLVAAWEERGRVPWQLLCAFFMVWAVTLSRTRGAWLALAVAGAWCVATLFLWRKSIAPVAWARAAMVAAACVAGIAAAVVLPNDLSWQSDTPYKDSARSLTQFRSGSGHVRLVQHRTTLQMIRQFPVLGVGPGNWPVRYPEYARIGDPSFRPDALFPTNRLPHGDWLGIAAERGLIAAAALAAMICLLLRRSWYPPQGQKREAGRSMAFQGCLATLVVIGTFDPALLTPTAAFVSALLLGSLAPQASRVLPVLLGARSRYTAAILLFVTMGAFLAYSTSQMRAALRYAHTYTTESLDDAVRLNPGDYQAQVMLAQRWIRQGHCERALPHLRSAAMLLPSARAPHQVWARCASQPGGTAALRGAGVQ